MANDRTSELIRPARVAQLPGGETLVDLMVDAGPIDKLAPAIWEPYVDRLYKLVLRDDNALTAGEADEMDVFNDLESARTKGGGVDRVRNLKRDDAKKNIKDVISAARDIKSKAAGKIEKKALICFLERTRPASVLDESLEHPYLSHPFWDEPPHRRHFVDGSKSVLADGALYIELLRISREQRGPLIQVIERKHGVGNLGAMLHSAEGLYRGFSHWGAWVDDPTVRLRDKLGEVGEHVDGLLRLLDDTAPAVGESPKEQTPRGEKQRGMAAINARRLELQMECDRNGPHFDFDPDFLPKLIVRLEYLKSLAHRASRGRPGGQHAAPDLFAVAEKLLPLWEDVHGLRASREAQRFIADCVAVIDPARAPNLAHGAAGAVLSRRQSAK
jgi:hypothetical protein